MMIEVGNYGEILSDDTVHALQLLEPLAAQDAECCCCHNMQIPAVKPLPPFASAHRWVIK